MRQGLALTLQCGHPEGTYGRQIEVGRRGPRLSLSASEKAFTVSRIELYRCGPGLSTGWVRQRFPANENWLR